jgi:hypothetical protein
MDLAASWASKLRVLLQLFFVLVGHLFQESCKRWSTVLAEIARVLVAHIVLSRAGTAIEFFLR